MNKQTEELKKRAKDILYEAGCPDCLLDVEYDKFISLLDNCYFREKKELPRNPYFDTHSREYLMGLSDEDYQIELDRKYKYNEAQQDMLDAGFYYGVPIKGDDE